MHLSNAFLLVASKQVKHIATALLANNTNQLCIVMDGTYLPIQKSVNSQFQRRTYSMYKHKNLVKPMIITATVSVI
jgi:hypothetical protein